MDSLKANRIDMMFKFMDWDYLTDDQHDLVISFSDQYYRNYYLSDRQFEILSDIFKKAAEK